MASPRPAAAGLVGLGIQTTANSPLVQLYTRMPGIIREAEWSEMWGVSFADTHENARSTSKTTILLKFLAANDNNIERAAAHFTKTLKWRRIYKPVDKREQAFDLETFQGIGYVSSHRINASGCRIAVIWNLYGSIKNIKRAFVNMQECVHVPSSQKMGVCDRVLYLT